jgi:hypothetical protein
METGEIKPVNPSLPPRPGGSDADKRRRPPKRPPEPDPEERRDPPPAHQLDEYAYGYRGSC